MENTSLTFDLPDTSTRNVACTYNGTNTSLVGANLGESFIRNERLGQRIGDFGISAGLICFGTTCLRTVAIQSVVRNLIHSLDSVA